MLHLDNVLELGTSITRLIHFLCSKVLFLCRFIIEFIVDIKVTNRVDYREISDLYYYEPGGTSSKNLIHWVQIYQRQELALYDYGRKGNREKYGTDLPPRYNVDNFKDYNIPTIMTMSDSDPFSDEKDIDFFFNAVGPSKAGSLVKILRLTNYNHLDYLWADSAIEDVFKPIIAFLASDDDNSK